MTELVTAQTPERYSRIEPLSTFENLRGDLVGTLESVSRKIDCGYNAFLRFAISGTTKRELVQTVVAIDDAVSRLEHDISQAISKLAIRETLTKVCARSKIVAEKPLSKVVEFASPKTTKAKLANVFLSFAASIPLAGKIFAPIESAKEYFKGYQTFKEIYEAKGSMHARAWAVKNAGLAVGKAALALADIGYYTIARSTVRVIHRTKRALARGEGRTARGSFFAGLLAGYVTEQLIGKYLGGLFDESFWGNIAERSIQWGCRWAAAFGESRIFARLGTTEQERNLMADTFFDGAMIAISLNYISQRFGIELNEVLTGALAVQTVEAAALPQSETITGEVPQLDPENFNVDLDRFPTLKVELERIAIETDAVQEQIGSHGLSSGFKQLGKAIRGALADDNLDAKELNLILKVANSIDNPSETLTLTTDTETPEPLTIFTGNVRDRWEIGSSVEGQAPTLETLTLNGRSWHLPEQIIALWKSELGISPDKDTDHNLRSLLALGINSWAERYKECFASRRLIEPLLGRTTDTPLAEGTAWHTLLSLFTRDGNSISDADFRSIFETLNKDDALAILFHLANGTASVQSSFSDTFVEDLLKLNSDITEADAQHLARQALAELSRGIVSMKAQDFPELLPSIQSEAAVTIDLQDVNITERLFKVLGIEHSGNGGGSDSRDQHLLKLALSALEKVGNLHIPSNLPWEIRAVQEMFGDTKKLADLNPKELHKLLQKYLNEFTVAHSILEQIARKDQLTPEGVHRVMECLTGQSNLPLWGRGKFVLLSGPEVTQDQFKYTFAFHMPDLEGNGLMTPEEKLQFFRDNAEQVVSKTSSPIRTPTYLPKEPPTARLPIERRPEELTFSETSELGVYPSLRDIQSFILQNMNERELDFADRLMKAWRLGNYLLIGGGYILPELFKLSPKLRRFYNILRGYRRIRRYQRLEKRPIQEESSPLLRLIAEYRQA